MLLQRNRIRLHLFAALPTVLLCAGCAGFYAYECSGMPGWPGGGSPAGLTCGIAAGLIIAFEMLLWPRKALRRFRLIATKYWMSAHIWLGLASAPLAVLHCGFHLGGWLPTMLMVSFLAAIASGIYGLALQNVLPRWMLRNLPAETIYGQIDFVSARACDDARGMVTAACGPHPDHAVDLADVADTVPEPQPIIVGAVRTVGRTTGRTLQSQRVPDARRDGKTLWEAYDSLAPFLLQGAVAETPVSNAADAGRWFQKLESACSTECQGLIENLQSLYHARRQFDTQRTVHRWLHAWLPLHIGVSIFATVLLVIHTVTSLYYW